MWEKCKASEPNLYNAVLRSIPWLRLGMPDVVANAALFLCSDAATWVTGQTPEKLCIPSSSLPTG